jgi:molybdopterin converting factor small subunit
VPATFGFFAVWNETLHAKLGEEGEKQLEALAEKVNACLDERERIIPEKREELETALRAYREALEAAVGARLARLDMLLKAVPEVAEILRAS